MILCWPGVVSGGRIPTPTMDEHWVRDKNICWRVEKVTVYSSDCEVGVLAIGETQRSVADPSGPALTVGNRPGSIHPRSGCDRSADIWRRPHPSCHPLPFCSARLSSFPVAHQVRTLNFIPASWRIMGGVTVSPKACVQSSPSFAFVHLLTRFSSSPVCRTPRLSHCRPSFQPS